MPISLSEAGGNETVDSRNGEISHPVLLLPPSPPPFLSASISSEWMLPDRKSIWKSSNKTLDSFQFLLGASCIMLQPVVALPFRKVLREVCGRQCCFLRKVFLGFALPWCKMQNLFYIYIFFKDGQIHPDTSVFLNSIS